MTEKLSDKKFDRDAPTRSGEMRYEIGGQSRSMQKFTLDPAPIEVEAAAMQTGDWKNVIRVHRERNGSRLISESYGDRYADIPYVPLLEGGSRVGDYTTLDGQSEFKDSEIAISSVPSEHPVWADDLWRFARLKNPRTFLKDEMQSCLRNVEIVNGVPRFTIGGSPYSSSFYSMGSEGLKIEVTHEDREKLQRMPLKTNHIAELDELCARLRSKYGNVTLREAILTETHGRLPSFSEHVYDSALGVAGTVLTKDDTYVFVRRGASVGVNRGINVTASGGLTFDREDLSRYGFGEYMGNHMSREAHEEIGIKAGTLIMGALREKVRLEIGLSDESTYDLIPVGFVRELPRGGSPEMMFLIRYKGSTEDLVRSIMHNEHVEKFEIDREVFAMPSQNTHEILTHSDGARVLQHKAALNLLLINEWRKQHGDQ